MTVLEVEGAGLTLDPTSLTLRPAASGNVTATLRNLGNAPETVSFIATTAAFGWDVTITPGAAPVDPFGTSNAGLEVRAPPDAVAGSTAAVNVTARLSDLTAATTMLTATVLAVHGQDLTAPEDDVTGLPGATVQVPLQVWNLGNAPAVLTLSSTLPSGWTGDLPREVALPPFGTASVVANLTIPTGTLAGPVLVPFLVNGPGGTSSADATIVVDPVPRLEVSGGGAIHLRRNVTEAVKVSAVARNAGNVALDVGVRVDTERDGPSANFTGLVPRFTIEPGQEVRWDGEILIGPKDGNWTVTLAAFSADQPPAGGRATWDVSITTDPPPPPPSLPKPPRRTGPGSALLIGMAAAIAALALLGVLLFLRSRKRPPVPESPPEAAVPTSDPARPVSASAGGNFRTERRVAGGGRSGKRRQ